MKKYVLGFATDMNKVLLIQKQRPAWQKGMYNGIGGKIEDSDLSSYFAMAREFHEEVGIETEPSSWRHFLTLTDNALWQVECFVNNTAHIRNYRQMTDEMPAIVSHSFVYHPHCLSNLKWIIPMIEDSDLIGRPPTVVYRKNKEGV